MSLGGLLVLIGLVIVEELRLSNSSAVAVSYPLFSLISAIAGIETPGLKSCHYWQTRRLMHTVWTGSIIVTLLQECSLTFKLMHLHFRNHICEANYRSKPWKVSSPRLNFEMFDLSGMSESVIHPNYRRRKLICHKELSWWIIDENVDELYIECLLPIYRKPQFFPQK